MHVAEHHFLAGSIFKKALEIFHYPTRGYSTTRLLSSLPYPTLPETEKPLPVRACSWWKIYFKGNVFAERYMHSKAPGGYRWWLLRHYLPQLRDSVVLMGRNSGGCDNYFHPYITFHLHRFSLEENHSHLKSECFAKVSFIEDTWIQYIFHLGRFGFVLRNTQNGMVCHGVNGAIFKLKWDTFWAIFGTL